MKKKSIFCVSFAILFGLIHSEFTFAALEKNVSHKKSSVKAIPIKESESPDSFYDESIDRPVQNIKEIEVNSVNFVKLREKANEIFIPNPDIADVDMLSDSSLYLTGLKPGVTSLVVHNRNGNIIWDYQVKVTYPIKEIKRSIAEMCPDADVEIISLDNSIILRGKVPSPEMAADVQDIVKRFVDENKIINKLLIETATQVMLKVKIAEVSRNLTKSLGINWRAISHSQGANGTNYGFMAGDASGFPVFSVDSAENAAALTTASGILGKTLSGGRWLVHVGGN
ncbi:MAG: pilus assembly protein N-terminal domain-containing protein, partial [Holosporaceae bacterium]|nr:pilus assembly protein N-terminal domain-containing protein [Holosporaceae bacterium]